MLKEFVRFHSSHDVPCHATTKLQRAAAFLIDANIVRGDTLTGLTWLGEEIQFSWWNRVVGAAGAGAMVQREPFKFAALREDSMIDFTAYDTFAECPIDQVHEQARIGG